jgi:hypothetical protein
MVALLPAQIVAALAEGGAGVGVTDAVALPSHWYNRKDWPAHNNLWWQQAPVLYNLYPLPAAILLKMHHTIGK